MATDTTVTRTNYFKVTDISRFRDIMSKTHCDLELEVWEKEDGRVGFGGYGSIIGFMKEINDPDDPDTLEYESYDDSYDDFAKALQNVIAEGDACIIMEVGNCKLRSVYGDATIIAKDGIQYMNFREMAIGNARKILRDDGWDTETDY